MDKLENELQPHQVHLLQIMALPAAEQIGDFRWEHDDVPWGISIAWEICFTGFYRNGSSDLLDGFHHDIIEMDERLREAALGRLPCDWSNHGLAQHGFWASIREQSKDALRRRGLPLAKPVADDWFRVLPEELH